MSIELDHLFVCVAKDGVEAATLIDFGLSEGSPNTHPGQGTACRRFFFRNAYLELLWVDHPVEAQSELVRPTRLWDRWEGRKSGACPFGWIFRPTASGQGTPPFVTWPYHPPYLPEPLTLAVANNADVLTEPLLFWFPMSRHPGQVGASVQPLDHDAGLAEVTSVELLSPSADQPSPALRALIDAGLIRVRAGADFHVKLIFDDGSNGREVDFRPTLPLVFGW
ncbi:MAG TPA: VOC family protein [Verrucomicrobiae bacterium]|nr:VOC family protein [Verrucomicrobiae bacterium]